jgi:hypothetical protein
MRPLPTTVVIGLTAALVAIQALAQTKSAEDDFLSWARGELHPVSTASGAPQGSAQWCDCGIEPPGKCDSTRSPSRKLREREKELGKYSPADFGFLAH